MHGFLHHPALHIALPFTVDRKEDAVRPEGGRDAAPYPALHPVGHQRFARGGLHHRGAVAGHRVVHAAHLLCHIFHQAPGAAAGNDDGRPSGRSFPQGPDIPFRHRAVVGVQQRAVQVAGNETDGTHFRLASTARRALAAMPSGVRPKNSSTFSALPERPKTSSTPWRMTGTGYTLDR